MSTPVQAPANDAGKGGKADDSSYSAKFKLPTNFYGGNSLDVAPPSAVKDFVAAHGGHTVITKVSISNSIADMSDEHRS